ncbi:MAG: flagellar biosynthetic protein FliO [Polyangiales bacterium]
MIPALAALAQAADELPPGTGGFGAQLARTSLALLIVCVAAWWLVRYAARRGMLGASAGGTHMTVIERVALDPRRALHLVRVGKRVLVVGASDEGLRTLAELAADELELDARESNPEPSAEPAKPKRSFADALAAVTEKKS